MQSDDRDRIAGIVAQFSDRGDRGEVWKSLALVLDTNRYLNLGYSPRFVPSVIGSPQRRLAARMGNTLVTLLDESSTCRLLDVGSGRGGPSAFLADAYGFDVIGIDLVPRNVRLARTQAASRSTVGEFVVGDAHRLPFQTDRFDTIVAIDSAPYVSDRERWLRELGRVVADGGVMAISDLVIPTTSRAGPRDADVESFLDAWDMGSLASFEFYRDGVGVPEWTLVGYDDITRGSIGRLSKWTGMYLTIERSPAYDALRWAFRRNGIVLDPLTDRIRRTHPVISRLKHVIFYGKWID